MPSTKTLSARNKAFWAKKPAQQRIAVAKDVLKQIDNKFYTASSGDYCQFRNIENAVTAPTQLDDLFTTLRKEKATCAVCGIGGCFVSLVNLGNEVKTKDALGWTRITSFDGLNSSTMRKQLRKIFTPIQLTLIEAAFEECLMSSNGLDLTEDEKEHIVQAISFGKKYKTDRGRLIAIMKNIIKNKGDFKP